MNHNGFVAGTNLDFSDFKNDINHSFDTTAATIRSPVGDVKLTHLLNHFSLRERERERESAMYHIIIILSLQKEVTMEVFVTTCKTSIIHKICLG